MSPTVQLFKPARDEKAAVTKRIREVLAIQQLFARPIIAAGIFNDNGDLWTDVISSVAKPKAAAIEAALIALFDRMESQAPGSSWMTDPTDKRDVAAIDVVCDLYTRYADAGFLVGLAVGMQLGPHAFDGGER